MLFWWKCTVLYFTLMFIQECEEEGGDYDRVKLLEVGADEAEKWERKKKKKNPDPGFSGINK